MAYQNVFKRYEMKYLLSLSQKQAILQVLSPYMSLDSYGRTEIRNLYFDTDHYRLIRRSIEKPIYKEKIRLRSYGAASPERKVFVELKKKYEGVVYKRRIALFERDAMRWLSGETPCPENSQIAREIDYLLSFYGGLKPKVFLSYEREAYYDRGGSSLRITFDDRILARTSNLSLGCSAGGTEVLDGQTVLMEVKTAGGLPPWLTAVLSREHIYKHSFSKYGTVYKNLIFPEIYQQRLTKSKEFMIHAGFNF